MLSSYSLAVPMIFCPISSIILCAKSHIWFRFWHNTAERGFGFQSDPQVRGQLLLDSGACVVGLLMMCTCVSVCELNGFRQHQTHDSPYRLMQI